MSAQSIPGSHLGNVFFYLLPNDAPVFDYFRGEKGALILNGDERSIGKTARVCKAWRDDPQLILERQAARMIFAQRVNLQACHRELSVVLEYPRELSQLFQRCHTPIHQLPELNLGDQYRDYIDFIQTEDMNQSVMRFRDVEGRFGLALKIRANMTSLQRFDVRRHWRFKVAVLPESYELVMVIFRRREDIWPTCWGEGNSGTIRSLYEIRHTNDHTGPRFSVDCPTCPFVTYANMNSIYLTALLNGTDPDFSLPGHPQNARQEHPERKDND